MCLFFFFNDTATTEIYTLSVHDALPILCVCVRVCASEYNICLWVCLWKSVCLSVCLSLSVCVCVCVCVCARLCVCVCVIVSQPAVFILPFPHETFLHHSSYK